MDDTASSTASTSSPKLRRPTTLYEDIGGDELVARIKIGQEQQQQQQQGDVLTRRSSSSTTSSATPGTSGAELATTDGIPSLHRLLADVERDAAAAAMSVDRLIVDLKDQMRVMGTATVDALNLHEEAVRQGCEAADGAVRAFYSMMAGIDKLFATKSAVQRTAANVHDLRALVDAMESQVTRAAAIPADLARDPGRGSNGP